MDNAYKKAKKRVKKKKDFFKELGAYIPISIGLICLNMFTNPNYLWFLWAIGPWGISLMIKGFQLAIENKTDNWEDRAMRKELRAMGKDPDDYLEDPLELKDIEPEYADRRGDYRDSDFV